MTPNPAPGTPTTAVIPDEELVQISDEELQQRLREVREALNRGIVTQKADIDRMVARTTTFLAHLEGIERLRAKKGKALSAHTLTRVEDVTESLLQTMDAMDALMELLQKRAAP
jgi:hypothetical protein